MAFTADLNPKKSSMDLGDLLKMDETMAKRKLYQDALAAKSQLKTSTPGADAVLNNLKSSAEDKGVPFKFGNNYQSEE
jgi:hypothetical protein